MNQFGLNACRKCLTPGTDVQLTSIFDLPRILEVFEAFAEIEFSNDKGKNDALVCQSCVDEIDEAFEFRQKVLDSEAKYFKPLREKAIAGLHDNSDSGNSAFDEFKVCRCCLTPSSKVETTTIFKKLGQNGMEYVEMLFHFTDFKMTIDYCQFDVLLCVSCVEELEQFFRTRETMRQAKLLYFYPQRKIIEPKASPRKEVKTESKNLNILQLAPSAKAAVKKAKPKKLQVEPAKPAKVQKKTKWKCSVCGKFLSSSWALQCHLDAVHEKIKRFACDICGHSVYLKGNMESHMKLKHTNLKINPKPFHDKTRPFPCEVGGCSRRFKSKRELKQHHNFHSDERPFPCHCGKSFKSKSNLNQHQLKFHQGSDQ